jgi:hypothetical protein
MIEVPSQQRPPISGTVSAPVLRPDFDDLIANQKEIIEKIQILAINENIKDADNLLEQIKVLGDLLYLKTMKV